MGLRHSADLTMQLFNIIVVAGSVVALLAAHQYATTVVQTTTLSEAQPSVTTATVTVTTTQQANSTTSSTCTPHHCSFTAVLSETIHPIPNLSGEAHHTTTQFNPSALSSYEFFNNLGTVLGFGGLVLSLANFSVWWKRRHKPNPTT